MTKYQELNYKLKKANWNTRRFRKVKVICGQNILGEKIVLTKNIKGIEVGLITNNRLRIKIHDS